jgi:hypothetical protein
MRWARQTTYPGFNYPGILNRNYVQTGNTNVKNHKKVNSGTHESRIKRSRLQHKVGVPKNPYNSKLDKPNITYTK